MRVFKLSLVASVALTTFSTLSFAAPLEEAIKGVDVSGYLRYRYQDDRYKDEGFAKDANGGGDASHRWRAESIFKTPVVDALSISLGVRYDGRNQVNHDKGVGTTHQNNPTTGGVDPIYPNAFLGSGLGAGYDSTFGVSSYTLNVNPEGTATNVVLGKQYLGTPLDDVTEDRGTGILATNSDVFGLTFALGVFDSFSISTDGNTIDKPIYLVAAMYDADLGAAGNIGAQGWWFNVTDTFKYIGFWQFTYSISVVNFSVQYALASIDNDTDSGVWAFLDNSTPSFGDVSNQYAAANNKANIVDKNDFFNAKLGVDLKSINVPLSANVGYITNFTDGTTVSFDNQGTFNYAGVIWYQNSATGVDISAFDGGIGYTPYGASKDLNVMYADILYSIPIADKTLAFGLDFVTGTNKISDIATTLNADNSVATTTNSKIDFTEITPRVKYKHSKNLALQAYYGMLSTKNKSDDWVGNDSEKRNRLRVEAKYTF